MNIQLCSLLARVPGDPLGFNKYLKLQDEMVAYVQRKIDAHVAALDPSNPRDYVDLFLIEKARQERLQSSKMTASAGDVGAEESETANEEQNTTLRFFSGA